MARHALTTTAAAFTIASTLLLTACGGGDKSSGTIKGADTGSGSPSASAPATDANAPDVSVPSDFHLVCDFATPSDAKQAAALSDASGKVKYFEGTPIPTSVVIVALLGAAFYVNAIHEGLWLGAYRLGPATLHPLTLLYALSGSAMISATLRVPKP